MRYHDAMIQAFAWFALLIGLMVAMVAAVIWAFAIHPIFGVALGWLLFGPVRERVVVVPRP